MKSLKYIFLVLFVCYGVGISYGESISIPEEVSGVYLGMPLEDLLTMRPAIKKKLSADPEWRVGKKGGIIIEHFKNNSRFDSVLFVFEEGRLASLMFYMVSSDKKQVLARRKQVYDYCATRFGKDHRKEVGVLEGKSSKPRRKTPALIWGKANGDVYLLMPESSSAKSPNAILMLVGTTAKAKYAVGFEKEDIPDIEKKEIFKAAGVAND